MIAFATLPKLRFSIALLTVVLINACTSQPSPPPEPRSLGQLVLANDTQLIAPDEFDYTGSGTYIFPDGSKWIGDFVDGQLHGQGREERAGIVYEGSYVGGIRQGHGTLTEPSGLRYQGLWQNGAREGFGGQTYPDGSNYEGEWAANRRHGFGAYLTANAHRYEGQWQRDKMHGYGTMVASNGVVYEGMWSDNLRAGVGRETRPDGSIYEGQFLGNKKHGEGIETHSDGTSHQGFWQEDQILGVGDRTTRAGLIFSGAWTRNLITYGLVTLPDGQQYAGNLFNDKGKSVAQEFVDWLTSAARDGSAYAQYFLALAYLDYAEPLQDRNLAKIYLESAAAGGIADAQYRLALEVQSQDIGLSLSLLQNAAEQNHGLANARLGEYRHIGRHLEKNLPAAIEHYETAVRRGVANAANNLSWLLATTSSESADPARAIELIQPMAIYTGNWQYLDTLAAAHARLNHFKIAIDIQNEALRLLQQDSRPGERGDVFADMQVRLRLYEQEEPYVE